MAESATGAVASILMEKLDIVRGRWIHGIMEGTYE
jgi:hypothetical protein